MKRGFHRRKFVAIERMLAGCVDFPARKLEFSFIVTAYAAARWIFLADFAF
jgi:hypothetical protein